MIIGKHGPEVIIGLSVTITKLIRELYNLALSHTQFIGLIKVLF